MLFFPLPVEYLMHVGTAFPSNNTDVTRSGCPPAPPTFVSFNFIAVERCQTKPTNIPNQNVRTHTCAAELL